MFHLMIRQDFRPEESLGFQTLQACLLPQSQFIPVLHFMPFKTHRHCPYLLGLPRTLDAISTAEVRKSGPREGGDYSRLHGVRGSLATSLQTS